jgi:hypothetical protein
MARDVVLIQCQCICFHARAVLVPLYVHLTLPAHCLLASIVKVSTHRYTPACKGIRHKYRINLKYQTMDIFRAGLAGGPGTPFSDMAYSWAIPGCVSCYKAYVHSLHFPLRLTITAVFQRCGIPSMRRIALISHRFNLFQHPRRRQVHDHVYCNALINLTAQYDLLGHLQCQLARLLGSPLHNECPMRVVHPDSQHDLPWDRSRPKLLGCSGADSVTAASWRNY